MPHLKGLFAIGNPTGEHRSKLEHLHGEIHLDPFAGLLHVHPWDFENKADGVRAHDLKADFLAGDSHAVDAGHFDRRRNLDGVKSQIFALELRQNTIGKLGNVPGWGTRRRNFGQHLRRHWRVRDAKL